MRIECEDMYDMSTVVSLLYENRLRTVRNRRQIFAQQIYYNLSGNYDILRRKSTLIDAAIQL